MSNIMLLVGRAALFRPVKALSRPYSATAKGISDSHHCKLFSFDQKESINNRCRSLSQPSRTLFTELSLGIPRLDELKQRKEQLFTGETKSRYIERLRGYIDNDDCKSIYRDDLVNLLGIANEEEHLDLLEQIVAKSDGEQATFFQGWGTTVMRLYYRMNQIERAERNIRDVQRFGEFFNLRSCYKIMMTMFYNSEQYEKVYDMLAFSDQRLEEQSQARGLEFRSDRDLATIALAALAKINNHDALEKAQLLFDKMTSSERNIGLRPASFLVYIASKNDDPKLALNLISKVTARNYVSLREIKILSLIKLKRYEDILIQMREYSNNPKRDSNLMLKTTFEELHRAKGDIQDEAIRQELDDILREVKDSGHVSDMNLEELIFKPIDFDRSQQARQMADNFPRPGGYQRGGQFNREGSQFRRKQYENRDRDFQSRDDRDRDYLDRDYQEDDTFERPRSNFSGRRGDGPHRGGRRFSFQNENFE